MSHRSWKPLGVSIALGGLIALLSTSSAAAAPRFAAPGGTATADTPCTAANPCSLFNAASEAAPNTALRAGDEVVVEPGAYSDAAGDLGPQNFVLLGEGITVHGVTGRPRPEIALSVNVGPAGMIVQSGDTLSGIEIKSTVAARGDLFVEAGTVDGVIARSSGNGSLVCEQAGGIIRDSACLSSGAGGRAIGEQLALASPTTVTARLRNVTAVSTGSNSFGLEFRVFGPSSFTVDGIGVIARGTGTDVFAGGFSLGAHTPGTGANVAVNLHNSDYARTETSNDAAGATPTITPPGSGTNITEAPLFAADGLHELVNSPTVDNGATDDESGTTDIDGQQRTMGLAVDIGADELLALPTTTTLSCTPASVVIGGGASTCVATVAGANPTPASGTVNFTTSAQGTFGGGGSCTLVPAAAGKASCQLTYTPAAVGVGTHAIIASYEGDGSNAPSQGLAQIQVTGMPSPSPPAPPSPRPSPEAPNTTLTKKPKAKSADRQAEFRFGSSQAGSTFQCKLDRGPFKPCRSPFAKKVRAGSHTFGVRAISPGGIPDPTPATFRWKVL